MASSAINLSVILSVSDAAASATVWLVIMIWPIRVASCAIVAAKTTRAMPDHRRAPMHITQGSPDAKSVVPRRASGR